MTKEELEKEAEDYAEENKEVDWEGFDKNKEELKQAYLAGAESREKRIVELEARIEEMKCCSNCDNWNWKHNKCEKKLKGDCFKHSKWVMRNF